MSEHQEYMPDVKRLVAQCQEISVILGDAGIGPCTLVEGVRELASRAIKPLPNPHLHGNTYCYEGDVCRICERAKADLRAPCEPAPRSE